MDGNQEGAYFFNESAFQDQTITPIFRFAQDEDQIISSLKLLNINSRDFVQYEDTPYFYTQNYHSSDRFKAIVDMETNDTIEFCDNKLFSLYNFLTQKPLQSLANLPPQSLLDTLGCDIKETYRPDDAFEQKISQFYSEYCCDDDSCLCQSPQESSNVHEELSQVKTELIRTQIELNQTQINLNQAQIELNQTQTELNRTKEELNQTQTEFNRTKEELNQTQTEFNRTKEELSRTQTEFNRTKEELSRTQTEFNRIKEELSRTQAEFNRIKEELNQTQAEFNRIKEDTNKHKQANTAPNSPIVYRTRAVPQPLINFQTYTHTKKEESILFKIATENTNLKMLLASEKLKCQDQLKRISSLEKEIDENRSIHEENLTKVVRSYQLQIEDLQKQIDNISQHRITKNDVLNYFETSMPETANPIGWGLLSEMFSNFHKKPNGRVYSGKSKDLYWALNAQGNRVYQTLHHILPTPAYNTINKQMQSEIVKIEATILDVTKIEEHINQFVKDYNITKQIRATLAVDAICVEPILVSELKSQFSIRSKILSQAYNSQIAMTKSIIKKTIEDIEKKIEKESDPNKIASLRDKISEFNMQIADEYINNTVLNNVFILYLQPLNPKYPCIPVHIFLHPNGSANPIIQEVIELAITQLEKNEFIDIVDISTDGDSGYQNFYTKANLILMLFSKELNIILIAADPNLREVRLASADFLHFLKTLRIKFLISKLSIIPTMSEPYFDIQELLAEVDKNQVYTDLSHIGKMRDVYPLRFFSLQNLNIFIRNNNFRGIICFLPWVCWNVAITDKIFTPNARLFLLKVSFEFCRRFYNLIKIPRKLWQANVNMVIKDSCLCTICTKSGLERLIPTLALYIKELTLYIQEKQTDPTADLAFDRNGSHPLENFNGLIRSCSNDSDSIKSASHVIGRTYLVKRIFHNLGIPTNHQGRVNTGGVRLSECLDLLDAPDDIKVDVLVDSLMIFGELKTRETVLSQQTADCDSVFTFLQFLLIAEEESQKHKSYLQLNIPLETRNASIDKRLFGYNQAKKEELKTDSLYI